MEVVHVTEGTARWAPTTQIDRGRSRSPLAQFKELFAEGTYTFCGTTVEGVSMTGTAILTHDFPEGPEILSAGADARVAPDELVVEWAPVTTPGGIDLVGYQVLVVQEEPVLRVFSADLPGTATRLSVPAEFVQPRTDYKVEVLAIEAAAIRPHRTQLPDPIATLASRRRCRRRKRQ